MRCSWLCVALCLLACDDTEATPAGDSAPMSADGMLGADSEAEAVDVGEPTGDLAVAPPDGDAAPVVDEGMQPMPDAAPVDDRPRFVTCDQSPPPMGLPRADWRHLTTELIVLGSPGHSAQDVIALPGRQARIPGKFAYGPLSKDLEDEAVEVYVDDCAGGWRSLGRALTDSDGRIAVAVPPEALPPVGRHALYLHVLGDASYTRSMLRVLPAGTEMMVFDIDGTLTTDDAELFREIFDRLLAGNYVPEARADGQALTRFRRETQGYQIVYLTGRPYVLTDICREWLANLQFAPGSLHLVDQVEQILPTDAEVGAFKRDFLRRLQDDGYVISAAYGNATTDIFAYGAVGIPRDRTFIAGAHGGEEGTVAVGDDYRAHLQSVRGEPPVRQPYVER